MYFNGVDPPLSVGNKTRWFALVNLLQIFCNAPPLYFWLSRAGMLFLEIERQTHNSCGGSDHGAKDGIFELPSKCSCRRWKIISRAQHIAAVLYLYTRERTLLRVDISEWILCCCIGVDRALFKRSRKHPLAAAISNCFVWLSRVCARRSNSPWSEVIKLIFSGRRAASRRWFAFYVSLFLLFGAQQRAPP